jgi:glycosyltransferase involved in cell wall biosynthesis
MKRKENIVILAPKIYPCKTGGMEIYNFHLVQSILKSPLKENTFIITDCKQLNIPEDRLLKNEDGLFFIKRYGLGALSMITKHLFGKKIAWGSVKSIYIPYTSNFGYNAFAFLILKKMFGTEYVIHIHGGGLGQWKPRWLLKEFFKQAKKIAGVSSSIVKEYTKRSDRKVLYLPPLIPFKRALLSKEELKLEKDLNKFDTIILFVGTLKPLKGPDTLFKAFMKLGNDFIFSNNIGLLVVGDGPSRLKLEEEYGNHPNIVFAGKIPSEKVCEYYAVSDYYVIPSWFEGTPISLLEAMFNGLICIGSDVTGINDIIANGVNGLLFEKDNHEELYKILLDLISNHTQNLTLSSNASIFIHQNFSYENHLTEFSDFVN